MKLKIGGVQVPLSSVKTSKLEDLMNNGRKRDRSKIQREIKRREKTDEKVVVPDVDVKAVLEAVKFEGPRIWKSLSESPYKNLKKISEAEDRDLLRLPEIGKRRLQILKEALSLN